jgi:enoyl-CoA hydratase/carnithine racemase
MCADTLLTLSKLLILFITVVNGLAAAAGCQLIANCDLVIAKTKSSFSTQGVK